MTTIKLLWVFCLIFTRVVYSQFISDYGMKIGMTASKPNFKYDPSINITDVPFDETRISPNIGIFLRFLDLKNIDFETQLSYLQKGGENKYEITTINQPNGTGEFLTFEIQFEYTQLGLGIRPKYSTNTVDAYSYIGGSLDYLLGVKNIIIPKNQFKDFVFGYAMGVGLSFNEILNNPIFLEVVYNSDISKVYQTQGLDIKNKLWLFRIGVSLGRNKKHKNG
jgi:hypothetical protein